MKDKKYIDLVFEGKNKDYGAYPLQQRQALFIMIGFLVSCTLLVGGLTYKIWQNNRPKNDPSGTIKMQHKKVVTYSQLIAPPPIETIDNTPKAKFKVDIPKQRAVRKFLTPVVKKDEEVEEEEIIPTQRELKKVNIGKKDIEGDTTGAIIEFDMTDVDIELDIDPYPQKVEVVEEPVAKVIPTPAPPSAVAEEKVYTFVEQKPEFPGGQKAMLQFMYENINYPKIARENGIMGTVVIKFVVETDGSITNIKILRDIGGGCSGEAVRVLQTMPQWNPGIQNQIPVRASFVLPVKFELTQ